MSAPGHQAVTDSGKGSFVGRDLYAEVLREPLWRLFVNDGRRVVLASHTVLGKAVWTAEPHENHWLCNLENESGCCIADLIAGAIFETGRYLPRPTGVVMGPGRDDVMQVMGFERAGADWRLPADRMILP